MSPVSEIALSCRGLRKSYGQVLAVDGLDLEVLRGECFGLLGPNGAGKTTTVEILEGLLRPDAGEVRVLGRDWSSRQRALRERLGIQLQEANFPEKLTVIETVTLFRSFYRRGAEPQDVLRVVQLEEKVDSQVRKLSGGQRQRLSLACALVSNPDVLFLDEPTTGLDPQSRRQIWGVVSRFRGGGGTVLLTTHYMEEAQRLCDRVAVVDRGRVIALGTPAELIAALGADHVVEFRTDRPADLTAIGELDAAGDLRTEDGMVFLTVREVHRALPALLAELRRQRLELTRLTTHHATLEDVFVSLTGRHLRDE